MHPLRPDARAWYRGALGELAVARRLDAMGGEWVAIHGVPIGSRGADIDHLIIGPSGVYTINTKRHADARVFAGGGSIRINGQPTQYVRNSQYEADRVASKLSGAVRYSVEVTPVIALVDTAEVTYGMKEPIVATLTVSRLTSWLQRKRRTLKAEQIRELSAAAARLSTWGSLLADGTPDDEVVWRFSQIDQSVSWAILRNRLWIVAAVLVGGSIAVNAIGAQLSAVLG
ncbi:MAG: nuclease-related domain-containing protein [Microcella sp.]|nr:nuclease-related domain-containing protein [Microcella sp.]